MIHGALALALLFATGAAAQYPERPIRFIVPQAAGSAKGREGVS